jgi:hypothetical protein
MKTTTVTRGLVRRGLRAARTPLDAAEVFARRQGVDVVDWYPARAFEGIEGDVKRVVGALLRDAVLVEEGYRHRARVDELRYARRLQLQAEGQRLAAEERFEQRHPVATGQRLAVDQAARALEHEHDAEADVRRDEARQAAGRQRALVDDEVQESRASVRAARRAADSVRVAEEAGVLEHEVRAAEAEEQARSAGNAATRSQPARGH